MKRTLHLLSLLTLLIGLIPFAAAAKQPNVILLISDDQSWNDYGFMGHPHIDSPRLDQLASESLVYERGYVTAPLCRPSLASLEEEDEDGGWE